MVVSDVRMPDVDGLTLLAQIRGRWPDLPVVLLTAHGSVPLAVEAMKAGATDFMLKPFDREEMLHVCRKAVGRQATGLRRGGRPSTDRTWRPAVCLRSARRMPSPGRGPGLGCLRSRCWCSA